DRLSFRAKDAIQHAAGITRRYGHNQIDTEHLLAALIDQPKSGIPALLVILNVDASNMMDRVIFNLKSSPKTGIPGGTIDQFSITPRARLVLEQAEKEAEILQDETISSPHLFLAILSESGTPAIQILDDYGLTHDTVFFIQKTLRNRKVLEQYDDLDG
ncbi:MAG: ATP-dependent Clp protease ATP-binding subunit, partial [Anaerolineaceae bacterium]|nr:ATP-dependent Clp protease ATP-binding subunit [Anaerolineaceae bacterium]